MTDVLKKLEIKDLEAISVSKMFSGKKCPEKSKIEESYVSYSQVFSSSWTLL